MYQVESPKKIRYTVQWKFNQLLRYDITYIAYRTLSCHVVSAIDSYHRFVRYSRSEFPSSANWHHDVESTSKDEPLLGIETRNDLANIQLRGGYSTNKMELKIPPNFKFGRGEKEQIQREIWEVLYINFWIFIYGLEVCKAQVDTVHEVWKGKAKRQLSKTISRRNYFV